MSIPLETKQKIKELHKQGLSSRKICVELGWSKSRKSTVNDILKQMNNETNHTHLPKVLVLDVENSPVKAYVWSLWKQNVGLNQISNEWFLLSFAAKWLGQDQIYYDDMRGRVDSEDDTHLLQQLWDLLDKADIVLTQNGIAFDIPKIKSRMLLQGFKPFSPVKHIDTLQIVKKEFKHTSNKLEWLTDKLNVKFKKLDHNNFSGFTLWAEMMKDNLDAFIECEEYNIHDILSLEELYFKLAPWSSNHVNFNLYKDEEVHTCRCGSHNIVPDGFAYTGVSKFQQFRCEDCGSTTRGRVNLFSKEKRASLHMNISQ